MTEDKKYYQISTLAKGLQVLELLAEHESLTVSEVARRLDLNRSASHRFLATLQELGYATKSESKLYQATFKLLEIGMKVANNVPLRQIARPFLQELASKFEETVNLGYWDGRQIVHLDKIDSKEVLRIDPGIGTSAPGHCTGLGKSILAYLPPEELDVYVRANGLKRLTPHTIGTRKALDKELAAIRERGYAIDDEELTLGLRCVSAPAFDYTGHICCSISIAALAMNMSDSRIDKIQKELRTACAALSRKLGTPEKILTTVLKEV